MGFSVVFLFLIMFQKNNLFYSYSLVKIDISQVRLVGQLDDVLFLHDLHQTTIKVQLPDELDVMIVLHRLHRMPTSNLQFPEQLDVAYVLNRIRRSTNNGPLPGHFVDVVFALRRMSIHHHLVLGGELVLRQ